MDSDASSEGDCLSIVPSDTESVVVVVSIEGVLFLDEDDEERIPVKRPIVIKWCEV